MKEKVLRGVPTLKQVAKLTEYRRAQQVLDLIVLEANDNRDYDIFEKVGTAIIGTHGKIARAATPNSKDIFIPCVLVVEKSFVDNQMTTLYIKGYFNDSEAELEYIFDGMEKLYFNSSQFPKNYFDSFDPRDLLSIGYSCVFYIFNLIEAEKAMADVELPML